MECIIIEMLPENNNFIKTCKYVEDNIVKENLSANGGTLNYQNLTYDSNILLVAIINDIPIGYASLVEFANTLYVYQIAVKKEYQQKGIGAKLIIKAINIAESRNMDVTANVMDYNSNSKKMFTKLGFIKLGYSKKGDGFYRFYQNQYTNIQNNKH